MLAYAIAGNSQNIANPEDKNCPHLFFSSSINFTPSATDISVATIDTVTEDDQKAAEKSLRNKWKTIRRIHEEKKKVVLFLHLKDWKKLKRSIEENSYAEKHLHDLKSENFFKEIEETNAPLVVAVESGDICKLFEILGIEKETSNNSPFQKDNESIIEKIFRETLNDCQPTVEPSKEDIISVRISKAKKNERIELCKSLKINESSSIEEITIEYRSVAGNSFANVFRQTELSYKEILVDVANKLKPKGTEKFYSEDNHSEIDIEDKILEYFAKQIADDLNKLNVNQRKKKVVELTEKMKDAKIDSKSIKQFETALSTGGAISVGAIVTLATGPLTSAIFYSGFFASIWAGVFGVSSTYLWLTGTGVGLALALPVFLFYLSSPSYRKTIPATLQLIGIRKRIESQTKVD